MLLPVSRKAFERPHHDLSRAVGPSLGGRPAARGHANLCSSRHAGYVVGVLGCMAEDHPEVFHELPAGAFADGDDPEDSGNDDPGEIEKALESVMAEAGVFGFGAEADPGAAPCSPGPPASPRAACSSDPPPAPCLAAASRRPSRSPRRRPAGLWRVGRRLDGRRQLDFAAVASLAK